MKKTLFNHISWLNEEGPFITMVQPSSFRVQDTSKLKLHFKNLSKEAKDKFKEKYQDKSFDNYQKFLDEIENDYTLWRNDAESLMFLIKDDKYKVMKLGIEVKAHVYVDDIPYLSYLLQDLQLITHFYVLALNRDSFRVYEYSNHKLNLIELDENAPLTLKDALGDDANRKGFASYSSSVVGGSNRGYQGGVGATRDEREVDRRNYFYTIDRFLRDEKIFDQNILIELFALPENYHTYLEITKLMNIDRNLAILTSPENFDNKHLVKEVNTAIDAKNKRTVDNVYQKLETYKANDRVIRDDDEVKRHAEFGAIDTLIVSVERLDKHDYDSNRIFYDVMESGGDVYILKADNRLGPAKMNALVRYRV